LARAAFGSSLVSRSAARSRRQSCIVLTAEAEWELLAWLERVVAMVASSQALVVDMLGELEAQRETALCAALDLERTALLVVLAAEAQEMALFHTSALDRGSTSKKQPTNTSAAAVTSMWLGNGETSLA